MERASAQWQYLAPLAAGADIETFSATSRGNRLVGNRDVSVRSARRALRHGLPVTCLAITRLIEGARVS